MKEEREEITISQAHAETGIAKQALYRYIRIGLLPSHPQKQGKRMVRIYRDDLYRFIDLMAQRGDSSEKYRAFVCRSQMDDVSCLDIINSIWSKITAIRSAIASDRYRMATAMYDCVDEANSIDWLTDEEKQLYAGALYGAVKWGRRAV